MEKSLNNFLHSPRFAQKYCLTTGVYYGLEAALDKVETKAEEVAHLSFIFALLLLLVRVLFLIALFVLVLVAGVDDVVKQSLADKVGRKVLLAEVGVLLARVERRRTVVGGVALWLSIGVVLQSCITFTHLVCSFPL